MRFNFKKVAAIGASALLTGMSMGVAAAANYPSPFTESDATAIVYGSSAASTDITQANNLMEDLTGEESEEEDSEDEEESEEVEGDSIQLKRSTDEFNLKDNMTEFYSSLDNEELSTILADGVYLNDQNEDFDYEQKLTLPSTSEMTHFRDRDYEDYEPTIGFHFAKDDADAILNYTLEFTPNNAEGGTTFDDLESTFIDILGKEYFLSAVNDAGTQITLLDSASTSRLDVGESETLVIDGSSFEVEVIDISSSRAIFAVNGGSQTNRLNTGDTQKVAGGDAHIGVTDVRAASFQGDNSFVEFSLGIGEIVLKNAEEVEINGDAVSQIDAYDGYKLKSYITTNADTTTDLEKIDLEWLADDDLFLTSESSLTMPGFDAVKLAMGDFITDSEETVTFGTGDPFSITTTVEDGEVSLDLLYLNSTEDRFGTNLGASSTQHLITNESSGSSSIVELNLANETYFVASWKSGRDAETYVYEMSNIKDNSGKDETTLTSLSGGSNVVFSETTDDQDVGRLRLTLTASSETAETATVKVEPISSGGVYTDRIFTKEGLQILLPVMNNSAVSAPQINLVDDTTWTMNFTEENRDGDVANGSGFGIDISIDSDDGIEADGERGANTLQIGRTGDDYFGYVQSDLATRVDWTKDTSGLDAMEVTYHGSEAFAEVFVSESSVSIGGSSSGSTAVAEDVVVVTDSEIDDVKDKDLIVVGGSCINSVAAELVGGSFCGDDWESATGVGSGEFLIKSMDSPYAEDKVAILVAGYDAADTVNAATYLSTQTVDTSVGKEYLGTSSTSAELVVEETEESEEESEEDSE